MKAFLVVGIGFYRPKDKSWDGVGLSIIHEISIPSHIKIPGMPEGVDPKCVEMTIVGMEPIENPNEGMNAIKGFIVSENREKASTIIRDIRDKIESGKVDLVKGSGNDESGTNPIDDFISKNGTKDFFAKN